MNPKPVLSFYEGAEADAIDAAMTVMSAAFDPAYGEAWTHTQLTGMLDLPGSWLLIARMKGMPAGFALVRQILDEAELLLIAVHSEWQRRAIGRTLMDRILTEIASRSGRTLHIEVREGNEAVNFYASYKFYMISRRVGYYRGADGTIRDALTFMREV